MLIETTTFRLVAGADEGAFLTADKRFQEEFIPHHDGFVRRTTARGGDDEWLVLTFWGTSDDANAAEGSAASDSVVAEFRALIDPASLRTARHETLD
jgi:hypothetical protein